MVMPVAALEWDDAVGMGIAVLAGILFYIALRAYLRTRTPRVLLFALAFGAYFVKATIASAAALIGVDIGVIDAIELVGDASILILFFAATLRA